MGEMVPVVGGLLVGAAVLAVASPRLRRAVLAIGTLVVAVAAGIVNGELAESLGFLLVDIPIVGLVALAVVTVARLLEGRRRPAAGGRT